MFTFILDIKVDIRDKNIGLLEEWKKKFVN